MIETERLILRGWREEDRAALAAIHADPRVARWLGGPIDRAASDALFDKLAGVWASGDLAFGAVERRADGALLGMAGLAEVELEAPVAGMVEIGWRLGSAHWGKGYATEAARAWLAHGFATLDVEAIVAFTAASNRRSRAVMRRLGMTERPDLAFDMPRLPAGHPLRPHVVCAAARPAGAPR